MRDTMTEDCPICMGPLTNPVSTACLHVYCKLCIERWLRCGYTTCPMCVRNVVEYKTQVTVTVFNFRIPKNTEELYFDIVHLVIIFLERIIFFSNLVRVYFGLQVHVMVEAHTSICGLPVVYIY